MKNNKRKGVLAAVLASAMVIPAATPAMADAEQIFTDVTKNHWAHTPIVEMYEEDIIKGYSDDTFRPSTSIRREHVAVLIDRALTLEPVREKKEFNDVSEDNPYYDAIQNLQMAGIMDGDKDGNFNPKAHLTRAQMAKVLDLAFDLDVKAEYDFPDVPPSHWSNEHVRAMYSNGITVGSDGHFKPNDPVTRAQYAVFMERLINLDEDFVPEPIEPPEEKPAPEPEKPEKPEGDKDDNDDKLKIKYSDKPLKEIYAMPKPDGYVPGEWEEKQEEKLGEIAAENVHTFGSGFNITNEDIDTDIETGARATGLSEEEFVEIVNWTIDTGEIYNGETFAIYFNYNDAMVEISGTL